MLCNSAERSTAKCLTLQAHHQGQTKETTGSLTLVMQCLVNSYSRALQQAAFMRKNNYRPSKTAALWLSCSMQGENKEQQEHQLPDLEVQQDEGGDEQCGCREQLIEEGIEELHNVVDVGRHQIDNLAKFCLLA